MQLKIKQNILDKNILKTEFMLLNKSLSFKNYVLFLENQKIVVFM
jgi:hypothetical protein